jgi:hypothetical protein
MAGVYENGCILSNGGLTAMCTVSFIARRNGYMLAMNRDEKRARAAGLPPALRMVGDLKVLCPSETGGGTWIAVNESGVTLALINWYSVAARVARNGVSRGQVIARAAGLDSSASVAAALNNLPLQRINPFRLIGIFPRGQQISEWRWNLKELVYRRNSWEEQQWISSGFEEPKAQAVRSAAFRAAQDQKSSGSPMWLRRLHRSHAPQCGPFSTCMHREDAVTVSYSEVMVWGQHAAMRHQLGSPCEAEFSRPLGLLLKRAIHFTFESSIAEAQKSLVGNPLI